MSIEINTNPFNGNHKFVVTRPTSQSEFTVPRITYENIGAAINAISPQELFWNYVRCNFFYPSKRRKLAPFIQTVESNWEKALSLKDKIFCIASIKKEELSSFASICSYRSTMRGWVSQHLVGYGRPTYPLLLMLAAQANAIDNAGPKGYDSVQNWYRPTNKYPNKVFSALALKIGPENSDTILYDYLLWDKSSETRPDDSITVYQAGNKNKEELMSFLKSKRSAVYLEAEGYLGDEVSEDIELLQLDYIYKQAGLSRRRYFWVAVDNDSKKILGVAIVNRAPIGMNFSMLESRTEILLADHGDDALHQRCANSLMHNVKTSYADYQPDSMPIVVEPQHAIFLENCGAMKTRSYKQFIWKKSGFQAWYDGLLEISKGAIYRWQNNMADVEE